MLGLFCGSAGESLCNGLSFYSPFTSCCSHFASLCGCLSETTTVCRSAFLCALFASMWSDSVSHSGSFYFTSLCCVSLSSLFLCRLFLVLHFFQVLPSGSATAGLPPAHPQDPPQHPSVIISHPLDNFPFFCAHFASLWLHMFGSIRFLFHPSDCCHPE